MEYWKALLFVGLLCMLGESLSGCTLGFTYSESGGCIDYNECDDKPPCGKHTKCLNTNGSFYCQCLKGFTEAKGEVNFTLGGQCQDINECRDRTDNCSHAAYCTNLIGSYNCSCNSGYTDAASSPGNCIDIDECKEANDTKVALCGEYGTCENRNGSYWCMCSKGYTNYGNDRTTCSKLDCDSFNGNGGPAPSLGGLADILFMMRNSCLALSDPSTAGEGKSDGKVLLKKLFTATEDILSPGHLSSSKDVSGLLGTVENAIMLIGPQLKDGRTKTNTTETDLEIAVQRGKTPPTGPIHLTNENASLDTDWTTAAGMGSYPGFALAALLSYKNLEISVNRSFDKLTGHEKDGVSPSFQISSRVVSVVVSNPSTQNLSSPVNITVRHLQDNAESAKLSYICAYWNESGAWSTDGCYQRESNATHTVCTCEHLSSFAVLMALYDMEFHAVFGRSRQLY
ncbi:adhesion G protein-coupled receptor E2-like [Cebidichthys violaceus]|uniref:adhesion G protein-coupled receptor E2-like n=1 Tax=Cebidichthys violaceus TaxID=271503 RepID=UPI0035CBB081